MGNSKGKPAIFININKPFYLPGQLVEGTVYINAPKSYPSSGIYLNILGSEKTQWKSSQAQSKVTKVEIDSDQSKSSNKQINIQIKNNKNPNIGGYRSGQLKIIQISYTLNSWGPNYNLLGQYAFPFTFHLPSFLPASFKQQTENYKASISYQISCKSVSYSKQHQDITQTQQIVIRIPQKQKNQSMYGQIYLRPTGCCCCCSKGVSKISCYIQKNQYKPGQECIAFCQVDNYKCKTNIKSIRVKFKKIITLLSSNGQQISYSQELNQVNCPGVQAHGQYIGHNAHKISLPLKYKNSKLPVHPSTNGKLIRCRYLLQLMPIIGGCCAKSDSYFNVGIQIVQQGLSLATIQAPPDWSPQVYRTSDFAIQQNYLQNQNLQNMKNPYYKH